MNRFEQKPVSLAEADLPASDPGIHSVICSFSAGHRIGQRIYLKQTAGKSGDSPGAKHFPVLRRRGLLSSIPGISETALRAVI